VEGADLGTVLAGYRADKEFMEPNDACRIVGEVCSALDYSHQKGVIHRDVKPANILLDRQGRAFLTDFGLALVADVGTRGEIFGSPHYIAPEQAVSSANAVPQSDLYSMGVILFEMFTGDVPFNAAEPLDIALLHMSEEPPRPRQLRPDISGELEMVILKALAKNPEERYPTGAALSEALDRSLKAQSAATLFARRSTTPRQTIPELVAMELGQPLPPAPAAVAVPTPSPMEETASPNPVPSPANKRPPILTGAMIGLGLLLFTLFCLLLVTVPSLMNRFGQRGSIPANTNSIFLTASTESVATSSNPQMEVPLTPSPESAPASQLATPTAVIYKLLIVRGADGNSVVVVNLTANEFPLSQLRLDSNNSVLTGAAWGVENLEKWACVGAWKAGEVREPPYGVNCELVGQRLERKKKDLFGGETIAVFYAGEQVGMCSQDQQQCSITIP